MNEHEKYSDVAADLLIASAEVNMLRRRLRSAYKRIMELETELKDEMYRHDRQVDWHLAREREMEARNVQ